MPKMALETEEQSVFINVTANQCPGCPENLAARLVMQMVFEMAKEERPIVFGQGCGIGRNFLQRSGLGTHDSGCAAMKTAMAVRGFDRPIVVIDGDGQIDMGLDDLCTAFQQGFQYLHVVCDNQSHAASGSHTTGATDFLARTSMRPFGSLRGRKLYPMILMFSGAEYAATASPSHIRDLERKVKDGLENMPAFIQVFTPCNPGWGYDDDKGVTVARLAVETGLWPLYEWKGGAFRRTVTVRNKKPVQEYTALQRRYAHLTDENLQQMEEYIAELNHLVDRLEAAFPPRGDEG
ncbi:MAG: thiamine pyrophosphate-dependent enzyme [Dehalococcoidia bacterium]